MAAAPPQPPASFKPVFSFLKLASDNDRLDPVVSYWCRFFAIQKALPIDSKSPEAKKYLIYMMDELEKEKKSRKENEAITNEMVAQAHVENYAVKIFEKSDLEERSGTATINTAKAYLAASSLFDVLTFFGELSPEIQQRQKYSKWRAMLIIKAVKAGERPPMPEDESEFSSSNPSEPGFYLPPPPTEINEGPSDERPGDMYPNPGPSTPTAQPAAPSSALSTFHTVTPEEAPCNHGRGGAQAVDSGVIIKAQKYCKFAGSALQYNDTNTAIGFLQKALTLLQTGSE